jgi:hypothetical protein
MTSVPIHLHKFRNNSNVQYPPVRTSSSVNNIYKSSHYYTTMTSFYNIRAKQSADTQPYCIRRIAL